jgi:hypothetical protein
MKAAVRSLISAGLLYILLATALYGQLYRLETSNLDLIYTGRALQYVTPHVVGCFERSLAFHNHMFDYRPDERVTILLEDFWDSGTGGTTAVPNNRVAINIAPFNYVYETRPANERVNWLMNHELVHVVMSDKASRTDEFFRTAFGGKVAVTAEDPLSMIYGYLTTPRWYCPRWYHEGIAVFMETWMAGGLGRVLGAYDEMVFRTMVRDRSYIYGAVGLESEGTAIDFQVGANSYLYGTRFVSYLALQYGPEKVLEWYTRTDDSKRYFATQFKKVYGVSLSEEWSRWIQWENRWQQENLERIRSHPTTPVRSISSRALGSVSRAHFDPETENLYAGVLYPGETAHIAAVGLTTGKPEKVCDIRGAALYYVTSLAYDQASGTLFFTTDNGSWRDLVAIDLKSGKTRMLIKDARVGDLAFNRSDRSIWGVRHYNGISTLVRIPHPYDEWNHVHSFPYGEDIFDLDISPDGAWLTGALTEVSGMHQRLIRMETAPLVKGDSSYEVLFDFENSTPANFVFSPDGDYLFGSSYYNGVSNIYRYDLALDDMSMITNCETGLFRPLPVSDDSLVAFSYTGSGFVPCMIANEPIERASAIRYLGQEIVERYPVVRDWILKPPEGGSPESLITTTGEYPLPPGVHFASAYPIVAGYKDYAGVGLRFNFSDRLGLSDAHLSMSISPNDGLPPEERFHFTFGYEYWGWSVTSTYNHADFYDLFGPTRTSRKGYSLGVRYRKTLLWEEPKTLDWTIGGAVFADLDELPDYQDVPSPYGEYLSFSTGLDYENVTASLGAVDYEKGIKSWLIASNDYTDSRHFPRVFGGLDYGFLLPVDHTSIWLRASAGNAFGDRDDPFSNFFFGGFGNNWVDYRDIKRFRDYYSFPGAEINTIGGRNFAKVMVEGMLPPLRFRRVGLTSAYLRWARMSLFAAGLSTNFDDADVRREHLSVGGQIDVRLVTFSLLRSTLSAGYAVAMEEGRAMTREVMVSLKIL